MLSVISTDIMSEKKNETRSQLNLLSEFNLL